MENAKEPIWKTIIKVIIAVATALLGVIGVQEADGGK